MLPLLLLVTGLILPLDAEEDAKKELEKIQGAWVTTHFELNGQRAPDDFVKTIKFVCTGDKYVQSVSGREIEKGTHKLDPSKKPKQMDITIAEGDSKGKVQLGIYELDGDTLKICVNEPGAKERPKELSSKAGSGHALVIMKREKKDK